MSAVPVAPRGFDRQPFECRLRFHRPLKGIEVVPADTVPAPAPRSQPAPRPEPTPTPPPVAARPEPAPAPTPSPNLTEAAQNEARERAAELARLEAVLAQVRAGVADLRREREGRLREWQRAAIELALTIASRLLHERVVSGDFPIDAKVRDMIAQLGEDEPVAVRLNPADLELLKTRLGGEPLNPDRDDPKLVADPTLNRGGCQVEGRESMLVSDVSRELQEIRNDLLRSLDNART
jgi:hypothetical protein